MKTTKLKLIGVISIFAFILFTTIGYSALNTNLTISGDAHVRVTKELRISNVELLSLTNGAYETYGSDYSKNTTSMHVTLPNTNSTATYKVTVINKTGNYFSPNEIVEQTNTNSNVTYELSGIESYNIYSGETLTFNVIFKTTKTNQKQDLVLEYNLKEITTTTWTFGYTAKSQKFIVPYNASYKIELWGASGGGGNTGELGHSSKDYTYPGKGGYVSGDIELQGSTNLFVFVGGKGIKDTSQGTETLSTFYWNNGGWNGGGSGYGLGTGTGGGSTDISLVDSEVILNSNSIYERSFESLKNRIMVAGAGGGMSAHGMEYYTSILTNNTGGVAGGLIGGRGYLTTGTAELCYNSRGCVGQGGTQIRGGTTTYSDGNYVEGKTNYGQFGSGGFGYGRDFNMYFGYASGGGSGYYGGSGTYGVEGAGGGSSFISGHDGCNAINSSSTASSITHSGQSVHYSGYKFTNTKIIDGDGYNWTSEKGSYVGMPTFNGTSTMVGNSGNGYAKITLLLEESAQEIEISNIELVSLTNGAYESSNNGFSKTTTDINVTLPNTNSTAMYKVTIANKTSNYFSPIEIVEKLNSNSNVKYAISGLSLNNVYKGSEYTFNIKLSTTQVNQTGNLVLKYAFEEVSTSTWVFDYTGEEQTFNVPYDATYKIETWGAQGGTAQLSTTIYEGGYGAYSTGTMNLNKGNIYINVGGTSPGTITYYEPGGYNGGGYASGHEDITETNCANRYAASGGGATHIATKSGVLSTLEEYKDNVLIVSGAGGGAFILPGGAIGAGAHAGGIEGNSTTWDNYNHDISWPAKGGTQTKGGSYGNSYSGTGDLNSTGNGSFGHGGSFTGNSCYNFAGGGSGFYGGGGGAFSPGAGGSSYIGNTSLTNKVMYCYNCLESSEISTKTISTTNVSDSPISNYAKKGNGYAKITLIPQN